jgi:putative iron-regulated protein
MKIDLKTTVLAASALFVLPPAAAAETSDILSTYADIALAGYSDALTTAQSLKSAVDAFLASPDEETLKAAKAAWVAARVPYQQTETFRFGNPIVDDWEGRVNAWPLDEGLIDYVDASYGSESDNNGLYTANVIANTSLSIDGKTIDIPEITPQVIAGVLQEAGGVEANVASGYHAIEFLLWGQDLNGTDAGAGARPATDFSLEACTNANCDRRRQYLASATDLLVSDLEEMVGNWQQGGDARAALGEAGLGAILTGMGSLSYGELAGERMKLGLLLHDPEEEHDCFSDNTANSHFYDAKGIENVYLGTYEGVDGTVVSGPSLSELVAATDPALDKEMRYKLFTSVKRLNDLVIRMEDGEAYDQLIGEGNADGNALVQSAIDALIDQTRTIERIVAVLDLGGVAIEGSDSLDSPDAVFQ